MKLFDKISDALKKREDLDARMAEQDKENFFESMGGRVNRPIPKEENPDAPSRPKTVNLRRVLLRLVSGTGSCEHNEYLLDPDISLDYTLGRGIPTGTAEDARRIFILDNESDPLLAERNNGVSRIQGQLFFNGTEWLLVRTPGSSHIAYLEGSADGKPVALEEGGEIAIRPEARIFLGSKNVCLTVRHKD